VSHAGRGLPAGPPGAAPHFGAQRPDHSPPELLSDDELARSLDSLNRKLHSARRMLAFANTARLVLFAVMLAIGFSLLAFGPAPFLELMQGERVMATTWDVFVWWIVILIIVSFGGAFMLQVGRRRRRLAKGWKHRVEDLDRRLTEARDEQYRRRGAQTSA
jgi:hypothetical protein